MKVHMLKRFAVCAFAVVFMSVTVFTAGSINVKAVDDVAPVDQADIENANSALSESMQKRQEAQALADKLSSDEADVSAILKELDDKITLANLNIDNLNNQIEAKEIEIAEAEVRLAEAQETMADQYESMKVRIKYMYENNPKTYLSVIFAAQDMAELLNKAAYFQSITSYDREMLEKYAATAVVINDTKSKLESDHQEIVSYKDSAEAEKESLKIMSDAKQSQLGVIKSDKETTLLTIEQYEAEAAHQEELIQSLKGQQAAWDQWLEQKRQEEENQAKLDKEQATAAPTVPTVPDNSGSGSSSDETNGGGDSSGDSSGMIWPTSSRRITTYFGETNGLPYSYPHRGIDIGAKSPGVPGDSVYAAASGIVEFAGWDSGGGGYMVYIYHGDGLLTIYEHAMSNPVVSVGDYVTQGQLIMYMGTTGNSTGVHLHFGVRLNDTFMDPLNYVSP